MQHKTFIFFLNVSPSYVRISLSSNPLKLIHSSAIKLYFSLDCPIYCCINLEVVIPLIIELRGKGYDAHIFQPLETLGSKFYSFCPLLQKYRQTHIHTQTDELADTREPHAKCPRRHYHLAGLNYNKTTECSNDYLL